MEWVTIISLIASGLFGAGGLVAFYKVKKTSQVGMKGVEVEAKVAETADWDALNQYWKSELATVRQQMIDLQLQIVELRADREADQAHIDELERWIYEGKPPPPPPRYRPKEPEQTNEDKNES